MNETNLARSIPEYELDVNEERPAAPKPSRSLQTEDGAARPSQHRAGRRRAHLSFADATLKPFRIY